MSLTFKLLSLAVRTAAKPIGNYIKRQAKEHEGFRRFAIAQAQRVHTIDMRMRLGILHDPEAQQRMHEREQKASEEKKRKEKEAGAAPTVRTEAEQKKYEEQKAKEEKDEKDGKKRDPEKKESQSQKVKIRPLSDSRAIELGANFFSEAFIFGVAVALLLAENFRSSRSARNKRDEMAERLEGLEHAVEDLRSRHDLPELEALNDRIKKSREQKYSWYNPAGWWRRTESEQDSGSPSIPGNVPGPARTPETSVKATAETKAREGNGEHVAEKVKPPERVDSVTATKKER